jgi:hypothetical protein
MLDVLFVAIMVAFFGLTWLFVKACEKIIGPDVEGEQADDSAAPSTMERAA